MGTWHVISPVRRWRLSGGLALAISIFLTTAWQRLQAAGPNILLVVLDDMGYGDASCYGSQDVQTPSLDAIAANGVRFTQFRVNPLCAPTRASILTGLYSLETGMWRGPSGRRGDDADDQDTPIPTSAQKRELHRNLKLLPEFLASKGYATGMFGKWHLGYEAPNLPKTRGFDTFVGFLGGSHPYLLGRNSKVQDDAGNIISQGHTTDVFVDHALQFIEKNKEKPFFCYVPLNAVHGPLRSEMRDADSGKQEWLARYASASLSPSRRDYCAVLGHADARLGDLIMRLRSLELEDDTLVIVVSDNGGILHTYPSNNGPLRGGKGTTFEGGVRVAAAMQWPKAINQGLISHAAAVHFDLFSTILDAAGIAIPASQGEHLVSGVSLLPHLRSDCQTKLPDRYLFWDLYGQVGALHGKWKMVGEIPNHHGKFDQALVATEATKFSLYNLEEDLSESHDLSDRVPEIYQDLKSRHHAWLKQFVDQP